MLFTAKMDQAWCTRELDSTRRKGKAMKLSDVLTIGATAAFAVGVEAQMVVLDGFSGPSTSLTQTGLGSKGDYQPTDHGFIRGTVAAITLTGPASASLYVETGSGPFGGLGCSTSGGTSIGKLTLTYGDFGNVNNPELHLDCRASGIGVELGGFRADLAVNLDVKVFSGSPANYWEYSGTLPFGPSDWAVDGTAFLPAVGSPSLADINSIVFTFSVGPEYDFAFQGIGARGQMVPEPGQCAAIAAVGLLGFAAWRRIQTRA